MVKSAEPDVMDKWKIQDAIETYGIRNWGKGYFSINRSGHVQVHPTKRSDRFVDLKELIDQLRESGTQLPILLRFTDILRHRVGEIAEAFNNAIGEYEYTGKYICVYPIKVNQQRQVVEEIL
ncbi:MAG: arginine decarboxylase, partial [Gemmataceae bacterium]